MALKKGSFARVIQPVVQGEVIGKRWNEEADQAELLLAWGTEEEPHERWLLESQLEEVTK